MKEVSEAFLAAARGGEAEEDALVMVNGHTRALGKSDLKYVRVSRSINGGTYAVGTADAASAEVCALKSSLQSNLYLGSIDRIQVFIGYNTGASLSDSTKWNGSVLKPGYEYVNLGAFKVDRDSMSDDGMFVTFSAYDEFYWMDSESPVKSTDSMSRTLRFGTRLSYMSFFVGNGSSYSDRKNDGSKWSKADLTSWRHGISEHLTGLLQTSFTDIDNLMEYRWNNARILRRSEKMFDFNHCSGSSRQLVARMAASFGTTAYIDEDGLIDFRELSNPEPSSSEQPFAVPDETIGPSCYMQNDVSFERTETSTITELRKHSIANFAVTVGVTHSNGGGGEDSHVWVNGHYGKTAWNDYHKTIGLTLMLPSDMFRYTLVGGKAGNAFDVDSKVGSPSAKDSDYSMAGIDFLISYRLADSINLASKIYFDGFSAKVYGFPHIELLDKVDIHTPDGKSHPVRPLSIEYEYDGTIKTSMSASVATDDELSTSSSTPASVTSIPAMAQTDCVVAQGICDFWTWRMWASGVAECWGSTGATYEDVTSEWGYLYEGAAHSNGFPGNTSESSALAFSIQLDGVTYTRLFSDVPEFCSCSFNPTGGAGISGIEIGGGLSAVKTPTVYLLRPTPARVDGHYSYYAKGRWR